MKLCHVIKVCTMHAHFPFHHVLCICLLYMEHEIRFLSFKN